MWCAPWDFTVLGGKKKCDKSSILFEMCHELHYKNYTVCNKGSGILFSIRHQHQHGHIDTGSYVKGEFV